MVIRSVLGASGIVFAFAGMAIAADLAAISADVPVSPIPEQRGTWAAIAFSDADEQHGFFWGADKQEEARDAAIRHCEQAGGKTWKVVAVLRNHRLWADDDNSGFPYNHRGALAVSGQKAEQLPSWAAESAATEKAA